MYRIFETVEAEPLPHRIPERRPAPQTVPADPNWIRSDLVQAAQELLAAAQSVGCPATAAPAEQAVPAQHVRSALTALETLLELLE